MAKAIMVQGTTSNAGKSFLVAALCRIFKQDGYKVAPFKSQNMALNSFITTDGHEMGRAQVMQAEAAGIAPDVRMNPILLKPTSDKGSQVIVNGEVLKDMSAHEYYAYKQALVPQVQKAYNSLAEEYDIIVLEGAGSPAEINLKENDIVNMGMAKMAEAPVLITGDIDRGGVFAALAGTVMLLDEDEQKMVKGMVINKFRGDVDILRPGLRMIEDIVQIPVVGVVPHIKVDLDDEDSLSNRLSARQAPGLIDIVVIRLPRMSNFTDFNPFEYIDGVTLRYIGSVRELGHPDLIILPGSKNTIDDLHWLRQSGLEASILKHASIGKPVFGICGGYQMLGNSLQDPHGVENGGQTAGLGLLDADTIFETSKQRTRVTGKFHNIGGLFHELSGVELDGYEIHMGVTCSGTDAQSLSDIRTNNGEQKQDGLTHGNIYGSYIHGLFDKQQVSQTIVKALLKKKGLNTRDVESFDIESYKQQQYDILAQTVRESLDMDQIYQILEEGI